MRKGKRRKITDTIWTVRKYLSALFLITAVMVLNSFQMQDVYADNCDHTWEEASSDYQYVNSTWYGPAKSYDDFEEVTTASGETFYKTTGTACARYKIEVPGDTSISIATASSLPYSNPSHKLEVKVIHEDTLISYETIISTDLYKKKSVTVDLKAGTNYVCILGSSTNSYYYLGYFLPDPVTYDICTKCQTKKSHDYNVQVNKAATCTEDGNVTNTCKDCGHTETVTVPKKGHHIGEHKLYEYSSSTYVGYPEDAYKVDEPTICGDYYTYYYKCDDCGSQWKTTCYLVSDTNYAYGKKKYDSHTFETDENGNYVRYDEVKKTCTQSGSYYALCTRCGSREMFYDYSSGHDYTESVTVEAGCLTPGYTSWKCSVCGNIRWKEMYDERYNNYKNDSTYSSYTDYDLALLTVNYMKSYYSDYGTDIKGPLNHDWTETSKTEATCTKTGTASYQCSRCGEQKTETLPLAEHDYIRTTIKEATYETGGSYHYECKNCDYSYDEDTTSLSLLVTEDQFPDGDYPYDMEFTYLPETTGSNSSTYAAIDKDGNIWIWGSYNSNTYTKPRKLTNGIRFIKTAILKNNIYAIDEHGCIWRNGKKSNDGLYLTDDSEQNNGDTSSEFERYESDVKFQDISLLYGYDRVLFLSQEGDIYICGSGSDLDAICGTTGNHYMEKIEAGNTKFAKARFVNGSLIAMSTDGDYWSGGASGNSYSLYYGPYGGDNTFQKRNIGFQIKDIGSQNYDTFVIDENGDVWGLGGNNGYVLNTDTNTGSTDTFIKLLEGCHAKEVDSEYGFLSVLTENGHVLVKGSNNYFYIPGTSSYNSKEFIDITEQIGSPYKITKLFNNYAGLFLLDEAHDLYAVGYYSYYTKPDGSTSYNYNKAVTRITAITHDFEVTGDKKNATCTASGYEDVTCKDCGVSFHREIAPLGHHYVYDTESVSYTGDQKTWDIFCDRCDERQTLSTTDGANNTDYLTYERACTDHALIIPKIDNAQPLTATLDDRTLLYTEEECNAMTFPYKADKLKEVFSLFRLGYSNYSGNYYKMDGAGIDYNGDIINYRYGSGQMDESGYVQHGMDSSKYYRYHYDGIYFTDIYPYNAELFSAKDLDGEWYVRAETSNYGNYNVYNIKNFANYKNFAEFQDSVSGKTVNLLNEPIKKVLIFSYSRIQVLYENGICVLWDMGWDYNANKFGITGYTQCKELITDMDYRYAYGADGGCYKTTGSYPEYKLAECDLQMEKQMNAAYHYSYDVDPDTESSNDRSGRTKYAHLTVKDHKLYVSGDNTALNHYADETLTIPGTGVLMSDANTYVQVDNNGVVDDKGIKYGITSVAHYVEEEKGNGRIELKTVSATDTDETGLQILAAGHSAFHAEVIKEATCTEYGTVHVTCTDCGLDETVYTDKIGHEYEITVDRAGASAVALKSCRNCGAQETDSFGKTMLTNGASALRDETGKHANIVFDCQGNAYSFGGAVQSGISIPANSIPEALNWHVKMKDGSIGDIFYGIDYDGNIWRSGSLDRLDMDADAGETESLHQVTSGTTFVKVAANVGNSLALALDKDGHLYISDKYSYYSFELFDDSISGKTTDGTITDLAVINDTGYLSYDNGKIFAIKRDVKKVTTSRGYYSSMAVSIAACPDMTAGDMHVITGSLVYITGTDTQSVLSVSEITDGAVTTSTVVSYADGKDFEKMLVNNTGSAYAVLALKDHKLYGAASGVSVLSATFPKTRETYDDTWSIIDPDNDYTDIETAGGIFFAVKENGEIVSMGAEENTAMAGRNLSDNTKDAVSILNIHGTYMQKGAVVAHTCTTDGYTEYTCSACNISFHSDITKAEHDWVLQETIQEASFGHFGKGRYQCSVCGETKEDSTEAEDTISASEWEYTTDDTNSIITLTKYRGKNNTVHVKPYYYVLAKDKWYHTQLGVSSAMETGPFTNSGSSLREIYIDGDIPVENNDGSYMFAKLHLNTIHGFPKGITNATGMFQNSEISNLDLTNGEFEQTATLSNLFLNTSFHTVKVKLYPGAKTIYSLFEGASGKSLELTFGGDDALNGFMGSALFSGSDIEKITADFSNTKLIRADYIFSYCRGTREFHVTFPDTVGNFAHTFEKCTSAVSEKFDVTFPSDTQTMEYCFYGCSALTSAPKDLPKASNYSYIFKNCTFLTEVADLHDNYEDLGTGIHNYTGAYEGCASIKDLDYKFCMTKNNNVYYRNMFKDVFPDTIRIGYQIPADSGYSYNDISEAFSRILFQNDGTRICKEVTADGITAVTEAYPCTVTFYCSVPAQALCLFSNSETGDLADYLTFHPSAYPNHPVELNKKDSDQWEPLKAYIDEHQYVNGICKECGSYEEENQDIDKFTYTTKDDEMILSAYGGLDTTLNIPDTYTVDGKTYNVLLSDNFDYGYYVTDLTLGKRIQISPSQYPDNALHFNLENTLCHVNRIPSPKTDQRLEVVRKNAAFDTQNLVLPDQTQTVRVGYPKEAFASGSATSLGVTFSDSAYAVSQKHAIHLMYGCGNPYVSTNGTTQKPFVTNDGLLNAVNMTYAKYDLEKTHLDADYDNFCDGCGDYLGSEEFPFEFATKIEDDGTRKGILKTYVGDRYETVDDSNIHIPDKITLSGNEYQIVIDTSVYLFMDKALDTVVIDAGVEWDYETEEVVFAGTVQEPDTFGGAVLEKTYQTHDGHNNMFYHSTGLRSLSIGASNMTNFNGFFAPGIGYNKEKTTYQSLDNDEFALLSELNLPDNTDSIADLFTSRGYIVKSGERKYCYVTRTTNLETVILPDSITDMYGAFAHVNTLRTVNIPQNVIDMRMAYAYTMAENFTSSIPQSVTLIDWAFSHAQTTDYSFADTLAQNTNITSLVSTFSYAKITSTVPLPVNASNIAMMYYASSLTGDVEFSGSRLQDVRLSVADTDITGYTLHITGDQTVYFTPKEEYVRQSSTAISTENTGMFKGCDRLSRVDITIPNIKDGVLGWMENKNIEYFYFDIQNITELNYTFTKWNKLKEVSDIPDGVVSMIGTFKDSALTTFPTIPGSVRNMSFCFQGTNITQIPSNVLNEGVENMTGTFRDCVLLERVDHIPDSVTNLQQAFEYCVKLQSVCDLPQNCTNLDGTFVYCYELETVGRLPEQISALNDTFYDCKNLKTVGPEANTVTMPDSVKTIARAFQSSGITTIGKWSENLTTLNGSGKILDISDEYVPSKDRKDKKTYTCGEYTQGSDCNAEELKKAYKEYEAVKTSGSKDQIEQAFEKYLKLQLEENLCGSHYPSGAFEGSQIEQVPDLPKSLLSMDHAFKNCSKLKEAPAMHKDILSAKEAFMNCSSMTVARIIAGQNLDDAFSGCKNLTTITDYDLSETASMNQTFFYDTALTEGIPISAKAGSNTKKTYAYSGITHLPDTEDGVTALDGTFMGCGNLSDESSMVMPKSVTSYNETFAKSSITKTPVMYGGSYTGTFADCSRLMDASVAMQGKVAELKDTFKNCTALETAPTEIQFTGEYIDSLYAGCENLINGSSIVSDTMKYADHVYADCKKLQKASFTGCTKLVQMNETFYNCESLSDVTLDGLKELTTANATFYNCRSLQTAPSFEACTKLKTMNATFYSCESLSEMPKLPDSVTSMENEYQYISQAHDEKEHLNGCSCRRSGTGGTFENCIGLTEIQAFPDSLISVPGAFKGCTSLTDIGKLPGICKAKEAFDHTNIKEIQIPATLTASEMEHMCYDCPNLEKVIFEDAGIATGDLTAIFGMNKNLSDRLFDEKINGYKLTTVFNQNNDAANNSVLTPERWMPSFRKIAGVYSSNMNKNGFIIYNEGESADIRLRLKGQDLNPVWFKADTTMELTDVTAVYEPSDYADGKEAEITFQSAMFDEYVANKGTTTASYVILFDVIMNDESGEYALVNNANANSLVSVYDTSTGAFNHIFQDDSEFGSLELAKKSNYGKETPEDISADEMKAAVTLENFRLCEININDSTKVLRPQNEAYTEEHASVLTALKDRMISLLSNDENTASDITDMLSTLTLSDLSADDDGSVYVCYLEAYNSGLRTLLQPVTLQVNEIESLTAAYTGDPVWVSDTAVYNKDDVEVIATYTDGTKKTLASDQWTESSLLVPEKGINTFTATANDASAEFEVPGVVYATLDAEYTGDPVLINTDYQKDDVQVVLYEFDADNNFYKGNDTGTVLTSDKWTESGLLVIDLENVYTATYKDKYVFMYDIDYSFDPDDGLDFTGSGDIIYGTTKGYYGVPGYKQIKELKAEYVGDPILITDNYKKSDVVVTVVYADNTEEQISPYFWKENSLVVNEKGKNNYTATYYDEGSKQNFTAGYQVPGLVKASISATYKGQPVRINTDYIKSDVEVVLTQKRADDTVYTEDITLSENEWEESGLTVTQKGDNTFTATYTDTYILNGTAAADYVVPGYLKAIDLKAAYTGDGIPIVGDYDKNEVEVIATFEDHSTRILDKDEWIESSITVTDIGMNDFVASYQDLTADYEVPGLAYGQLSADYKGIDIEVSKDYDKQDVEVILYYEDKDGNVLNPEGRLIPDNKWEESGLTVSYEGENHFTASYEETYIIGTVKDDYIVYGFVKDPSLLSIEAVYEGPDIRINHDYNKQDVTVTAYYDDNSSRELDDDEWNANSLMVKEVGTNTFTASFKGQTDDYTVPGVDYIDHIEANYTGDPVIIGTEYKKEEVLVVKVYASGAKEEIPADEWEESGLVVETVGPNEYSATYREYEPADYIIPGIDEAVSLKAAYTGPDIYTGRKYLKKDVEVIVVYRSGTSTTLSEEDWNASGFVVEKDGDNTYMASYQNLQAPYLVTGFTEKSLEATYKGPDIEIGHEYKKKDVEVVVTYTNDSKEVLNTQDWTESGLTVSEVGENRYTATYKSLTATYIVNGTDTIKDLTAVYKGPSIKIGSEYKKSDVIVTVRYTSGAVKLLGTDEWQENSLKVEKKGINIFEATYDNLSAPYNVFGVDYITDLKASYTGDKIFVGENYQKEEVSVVVTYATGKEKELTSDEWEESGLKVEKSGNNEYTASFDDKTASYLVPGYEIDHIEAEYKGEPVRVTENYKKSDVIVTIVYTDDSTRTLTIDEWKESSLKVDKVGENEFSATYKSHVAPYKVVGFDDTITLKSIKGTYPEYVLVGTTYTPEKADIILTYSDGSTQSLAYNKLSVAPKDTTVTKIGNNEYEIGYQDIKGILTVPGYAIDHITATYKGPDIEINHDYSTSDVEVTIYYTNNTTATTTDFTVDSTKVTKVNENTYTATHNNHKADFIVIGTPLKTDESKEEKTPTVPTQTQTDTITYVPTDDVIVSYMMVFLIIIFGAVIGISVYRYRHKQNKY